MNKTLLFRFDASSQIGIGHAFRCMALIERLSLHDGIHCLVVTKELPEFIVDKLQSMKALVLPFKATLNGKDEITYIKNVSTNYSCRSLVLDGYQFKEGYRQSLSQLGLSIITFDDCNDLELLHCHLVINALPYASQLGYEKSAAKAEHLLGLEYSILRSEFVSKPTSLMKPSDKLLVNFGGSDIAGLTLPLVKSLMQTKLIEPINIIVITGGAYNQKDDVKKLSIEMGFMHIHNCQNMAEILLQCRVAICAPGSIVYELAYCGVPSIFLTVADNQLLSAKAHQDLGWCVVENGLDKHGLTLALQHLNSLWFNNKKLEKMSKIARSLIDGKGVARICNKIKGFLS